MPRALVQGYLNSIVPMGGTGVNQILGRRLSDCARAQKSNCVGWGPAPPSFGKQAHDAQDGHTMRLRIDALERFWPYSAFLFKDLLSIAKYLSNTSRDATTSLYLYDGPRRDKNRAFPSMRRARIE